MDENDARRCLAQVEVPVGPGGPKPTTVRCQALAGGWHIHSWTDPESGCVYEWQSADPRWKGR
jgi:hypothetical protein